MSCHVFVIMPFGSKEGIDFNKVYNDYIKPALETEGFTVFRADEKQEAGEIRADMFQELLLADLVVADLSIDNPNVWYELGVRHALRARGIVLIQSTVRQYNPFDTYTDRKLIYHIKNGEPDVEFLQADKKALATMAKATMQSWHGRAMSPVYRLLSHLQEPEWKSLRVGDFREFWERHDAWVQRIELAAKAGHAGDVLLLADEAPVAAFRAEAWLKAGEALRKTGHFMFALEQLNKALDIQSNHLKGLQEKGICLERLACAHATGYTWDKARQHYRAVLQQYPRDAETWGLLGRVDKDEWLATWRKPDATVEEMQEQAADEDALLRNAIENYITGYRCNPSHYYSGINALSLMYLYHHLTGDERYCREMAIMAGAVRYAAECEPDDCQRYWAMATLADLEVLTGSSVSVKAAYKEAVAKNDKDRFALESSRLQLLLLRDLAFRPEQVSAGIAVFDRALQKLAQPETKSTPRMVFLFSGHMIDKPNRPSPRFPASKEAVAAQQIADALDRFGAGVGDIALTQGACGGDLLFTEACQQRGVLVQWMQPFHEPEFIEDSVVCVGELWRQRYFTAREKLGTAIRSAPNELGVPPLEIVRNYVYERCNLWLFYTALAYGTERVRFLCLWNGDGGDGPGGTAHMYNEVKQRTGQVTWIKIHEL